MNETLKVRVEEVGRSIAVQEERHTRATGHTKFTKLKFHNVGINPLKKIEMYVTKNCTECKKHTNVKTKE